MISMGVDLFDPSAVVAAMALLLVVGYVACRNWFHSQLPLPPGPRKLPLLGNLLDFPPSFEWEVFQQWGKQYNTDILHLNAGRQSIIVLNSAAAAHALLDKRSSIYSGRLILTSPRFTAINKIMGFSWLFPFMPYGQEWKERRRLFQRHFHPSSDSIHKVQELRYTHRLLLHLLEFPEDYMQQIKHSVGGILHSMAYGGETEPFNDPFINTADEVAECISDAALTSAIVVELTPTFLLPLLKYILPSRVFTKTQLEWQELRSRFLEDPYWSARKLITDGTVTAEPSFVSRAIEDMAALEDDLTQQTIIKDVASILFIGGSSTMNAILHTFVLAMLCFPDAQRKAQEELDRVIGRNRLPEFGDEPHLPYLHALLKEVQRWRPAGPLAIPHLLERDDEYNGYHIPGKSIVIGNVWAMLHDKNTYSDPGIFRPERFLKNGYPDLSVRDPTTLAFGFGRRICPGAHIAQSILWIMAASILSTFKISRAIDEDGNEIEPTVEYRPSVTFQPVPFKCSIKPRDERAERLARAGVE